MKPSMFRLSDLLFLSIPIIIVGLVVAAITYNLVNDAGEGISIAGWVVSSVVVLTIIVLIFSYYYVRWRWVRLYKCTVMGVNYFYNDDAKVYNYEEVADDLGDLVLKWDMSGYNFKFKDLVGIDCLFRSEIAWLQITPRLLSRLVTGISIGSYCEVGQGGRPIAETAHAHEISHCILNRIADNMYNEVESHEIFAKIGV